MKILRCSFLNKQTNEIVNRVVKGNDNKCFMRLAEILAEYDEMGEHGTLHIQFEEV
jgi:hypothetical protein